jgi:hypothetical protein
MPGGDDARMEISIMPSSRKKLPDQIEWTVRRSTLKQIVSWGFG